MSSDAGPAASEEPSLSPAEAEPRERRDWSDLGARIASGLVLAVGGVTAAWFGGPWLAGACAAAVVVMSYEYARMSEPDATMPAFWFALAGSFGAVLLASWQYLGPAVFWLVACGAASSFRRKTFKGVVETSGGVIYVGLPVTVFLWLRDRGPEGLETLLALFAIIWSADIFAYFGGKLIGGPKVAEGLSPKKTWSGITSGTIAGALAGYGCGLVYHVAPEFRMAWLAIGALLAFTGLMGDLFESFLKRRFGVKDASRVIPGHGGVMDRLDGLMAASLLVGAALVFGPRATAVLFGTGL